jgi:hypothetical protein
MGVNRNVPQSAAEWEQRCLDTVAQQMQLYRQNLEMAFTNGIGGTPEGLAQIIDYVKGMDSSYATYEPICGQLSANGFTTLATRIAELRKDLAGALTQYETMYANSLHRGPQLANDPPPSVMPLNTPDQIKAFYDHLKDMANLNRDMEQQSEAIRNILRVLEL